MSGRPGATQTKRGRCRLCGGTLPPTADRSAWEQRANLDRLRLCPACYAARLLTGGSKVLVSGVRLQTAPDEGAAMLTVADPPAVLDPASIFTRPEAAAVLGISTSRIDQLIREGKARRSVATASGRRLFSADDLAALARAIGRQDRIGEAA